MSNLLVKRKGSRADGQKYTATVTVRLTLEQDRLLTRLAERNRCSKMEVVRQAIASYVTSNASDSEIFHAALNDIKNRLSVMDGKLKKYPAVIYAAVKEMFSLLPERGGISSGELSARMDEFAREVSKISSGNRKGVFENIIIDCMERSFAEDGDAQ